MCCLLWRKPSPEQRTKGLVHRTKDFNEKSANCRTRLDLMLHHSRSTHLNASVNKWIIIQLARAYQCFIVKQQHQRLHRTPSGCKYTDDIHEEVLTDTSVWQKYYYTYNSNTIQHRSLHRGKRQEGKSVLIIDGRSICQRAGSTPPSRVGEEATRVSPKKGRAGCRKGEEGKDGRAPGGDLDSGLPRRGLRTH